MPKAQKKKRVKKNEIEKINQKNKLTGGTTVLAAFTDVKTVLNPYVVSHETNWK